MGHWTLLFRLSAVLRNALVLCEKFINHWDFFHKSTWPEFQPSLPRGLPLALPIADPSEDGLGAGGPEWGRPRTCGAWGRCAAPATDKLLYVTWKGLDRAGLTLMPVNGCYSVRHVGA